MKIKDTKKVEELKKKINGETEVEEQSTLKVDDNIPKGLRVNEDGRLTNTKRRKIDDDYEVVVRSNFKGRIELQTDPSKPVNFSEELIMSKEEYRETAVISHQFVQYLKRHHPNVFKKGYIQIMDDKYIELEKMERVLPENSYDPEVLAEMFAKDSKGYITDKEKIADVYKNVASWDERTLIAQYFLELINEDEIKRSDEEFLREIIKIEK